MMKINPIRIPGPWRNGYVLDYHTLSSERIGYDEYGHPEFDTKRSEIGELLYQLKYRNDQSVISPIVEAAATFLRQWNPAIDVIVTVPPTRARPFQPVIAVANALGERLAISVRHEYVIKSKTTPELKDVYDYSTRLTLLEDAFCIKDQSLTGKGVLLFDDLYRSGATLAAIANLLNAQAGVAAVYAFALTRTRSAS